MSTHTTPVDELPETTQRELFYWDHVLGHLNGGVITDARPVIDPETREVYQELRITSTEDVEIIATVTCDSEGNGPGWLHVTRADDEL